MGKKRRMIAKRSKFGKKFANHPCVKALQEAPELVETPVEVVEVAPIEVVEKKPVVKATPKKTTPKKTTPKRATPKKSVTNKWFNKKKDD
tara:strand:- start:1024 stop:1293 length:270 start_codon:yes stop_codon:yes gene_type:complete